MLLSTTSSVFTCSWKFQLNTIWKIEVCKVCIFVAKTAKLKNTGSSFGSLSCILSLVALHITWHVLLHRYECFTIKYATHRFHMNMDMSDVIFLFFLCFSSSFFFLFSKHHIYVMKRKLHVGLNIWSLSSRGKMISRVSATNKSP